MGHITTLSIKMEDNISRKAEWLVLFFSMYDV